MSTQMTPGDENRKPSSTAAVKTTATMARSLISSPPRMPSTEAKERRKASVTPRKFKRFFTPRSSQPTSAVSHALRDLTASALNRCQTPSSPLKAISEDNVFVDAPSATQVRASKRRKTQHLSQTPFRPMSPADSSPTLPDMQTSPSRQRRLLSPIGSLMASQAGEDMALSEDAMSEDDLPRLPALVKRITTMPSRGFAAQLVTRMTGGAPRGGHQLMRHPVADWRAETADFYSTKKDVHHTPSNEGPGQCIPFSVAGCNTNSLIAVGDEEGYIRLLDSNHEFRKIHLSFQTHNNAIIDIAFSKDDKYLATASGDQTGKVIDMVTQTPISVLAKHSASLKQVRFQPGRGDSSVLATSGRDGSIQIWDIRCNGGKPVQEINQRPAGLQYELPKPIRGAYATVSLWGAHGLRSQHRYQTRQNPNPLSDALGSAAIPSSDIGSRSEVPGRIGEVSVTAIQFLNPGCEHLLLSASECDSTVKLWDIRAIQAVPRSTRRDYPNPLSFTRQPDSHLYFRPYGISGLALSGDGTRFYSLCKDNTVYAYSTAHLMLGQSTELTAEYGDARPRHHPPPCTKPGLGPLYGFRHPAFHATSFYIKAALRPARDGRPELLAVGSADGCPVLFPTDERYFRRDLGAGRDYAPPNGVDDRVPIIGGGSFSGGGGFSAPGRPSLTRTNSISNMSGRLNDTVPVYKPYGTALVRGHNDKEVGPLAWTVDGKLVTMADDYAVRCWSEDREKAADLRRGGEVNGRRWMSGWADVGEDWEGDEDDW